MDRLAYSHNFRVYLGPLSMSFSKISGINNELSVETINEGGVNDRMIPLYTPKKTTGRLIFEHGIGILNGMNIQLNLALLGKYLQIPGIIMTLQEGKVKRIYKYDNVIPIRWSVSNFDAQNSNILIDTIEVMHQGIFEIL